MIPFREVYACPHQPKRMTMAVRSVVVDMELEKTNPGWIGGGRLRETINNRGWIQERAALFAYLGV